MHYKAFCALKAIFIRVAKLQLALLQKKQQYLQNIYSLHINKNPKENEDIIITNSLGIQNFHLLSWATLTQHFFFSSPTQP